jgi:hypothetical protein
MDAGAFAHRHRLSGEHGTVEPLEEFPGIAVDLDAPAGAQVVLREAAAQKTDRNGARFPSGLRVTPAVPDHDNLGGVQLQPIQSGAEDIGRGLGLLGIVTRGLSIQQFRNIHQLEVLFQFVAMR